MIDILVGTPAFVVIGLIAAYLIGSIPFGLVLCRVFGYGDIRKIGSGNIGATNVLRTGNKLLAFLTLVLDSGKGALVLILYYSLMRFAVLEGHIDVVHYSVQSLIAYGVLLGFSAILGHCFPIWLKFKGGKGVATALGTLLVAVPWTGVLACVTWGIVAGIFRYSSLSALAAMALAPVYTVIFYGPLAGGINVLITLLIFWRHKDNIRRLLAGAEPKIGDKKKTGETKDQNNTDA